MQHVFKISKFNIYQNVRNILVIYSIDLQTDYMVDMILYDETCMKYEINIIHVG